MNYNTYSKEYLDSIIDSCINRKEDYFIALSKNSSSNFYGINVYCGKVTNTDNMLMFGDGVSINKIYNLYYDGSIDSFSSSFSSSEQVQIPYSGSDLSYLSDTIYFSNIDKFGFVPYHSSETKNTSSESSSTDFNITKNEFYLIPFLLCLLILLLFLKWCFPFKGGRKL